MPDEENPAESERAAELTELCYFTLFFLCLGTLALSCYAFYLYNAVPAVSAQSEVYFDAPNTQWKLYTITVDTQGPVHIVDDKFVSFNLDSAVFSRRWDWEELNLEAKELVTICRPLAPAVLRVGGQTSNYILFTEKNRTSPSGAQDWKENLGLDRGNKVVMVYGDDWIKLNKFVTDVGFDLLFSLNGLNRKSGGWDTSNAVRLLRFTDSMKYSVHWQLGSELEKSGLVRPDELARDYSALRHLLLFWPTNSKLVGPDIKDTSFEALAFLDSFLEEGHTSLDAITFHHFYLNDQYGTPRDLLQGNVLRGLKSSVQRVAGVLKRNALRKSIWITEEASAAGDGLLAVSDSYASALLWLDTLGMAARLGVDIVIRQALLGSSNRLLTSDFRPLPGYWVSLLHKKLVGPRVLELKIDPDDEGVRIYAHCLRDGALRPHKGSVLLFGLNVGNTTVELHPKNVELRTNRRLHYVLSPAGREGLLSEDITLNGQLLRVGEELRFPDIMPDVRLPDHKILLRPNTMGFFVFENFQAPACTATY
ncbi:heparanase-like isoform X1 [Ornithodoros turicata]|uniref:heparanase-like isoform X1 n=1 Tax=Ornithodoros turicata TaxID=34597 RepID=UPI003139303E